jgi:hypothetical protein
MLNREAGGWADHQILGAAPNAERQTPSAKRRASPANISPTSPIHTLRASTSTRQEPSPIVVVPVFDFICGQ